MANPRSLKVAQSFNSVGVVTKPVPPHMSGQLWKHKRKSSLLGSDWVSRWFTIDHPTLHLLYFKSKSSSTPSGGVPLDSIEGIRSVDENQFEVLSPVRGFLLKGSNKQEVAAWVAALTEHVTDLAAYNKTMQGGGVSNNSAASAAAAGGASGSGGHSPAAIPVMHPVMAAAAVTVPTTTADGSPRRLAFATQARDQPAQAAADAGGVPTLNVRIVTASSGGGGEGERGEDSRPHTPPPDSATAAAAAAARVQTPAAPAVMTPAPAPTVDGGSDGKIADGQVTPAADSPGVVTGRVGDSGVHRGGGRAGRGGRGGGGGGGGGASSSSNAFGGGELDSATPARVGGSATAVESFDVMKSPETTMAFVSRLDAEAVDTTTSRHKSRGLPRDAGEPRRSSVAELYAAAPVAAPMQFSDTESDDGCASGFTLPYADAQHKVLVASRPTASGDSTADGRSPRSSRSFATSSGASGAGGGAGAGAGAGAAASPLGAALSVPAGIQQGEEREAAAAGGAVSMGANVDGGGGKHDDEANDSDGKYHWDSEEEEEEEEEEEGGGGAGLSMIEGDHKVDSDGGGLNLGHAGSTGGSDDQADDGAVISIAPMLSPQRRSTPAFATPSGPGSRSQTKPTATVVERQTSTEDYNASAGVTVDENFVDEDWD